MADPDDLIRPGTLAVVRAFHADGSCYRWWSAVVERAADGLIVTHAPVGHRLEGPGGGHISPYRVRACYWLDRPDNLVEVYRADGALEELFVHIARPARVAGHQICYTDHELDVVRRVGERARVVDEDDFARAVEAYGYTPNFQAACWAAVAEAMHLVEGWAPEARRGDPAL